MSYLIREYGRKYTFSEDKEKFGIVINANAMILPLKLSKKESCELMEQISILLPEGYIHRGIWDWNRIFFFDQDKLCIQEWGTGSGKLRNELSITRLDKSMVVKIEKQSLEYGQDFETNVDDILENTLIRTKLEQYWMDNDKVSSEEASERFRFILTGKTMCGEIEVVKEKVLGVVLANDAEPLYVKRKRVKNEIIRAFEKRDQELPLRVDSMVPKEQIKIRRQLEFLVLNDFSKYDNLDENVLEELQDKFNYWESLGVDVGLFKNKVKESLALLQKKARQFEENFL